MAQFRLFGIPVTVDPWFFFGLFFVYTWSGGGRAGLFAAVALGVLTLIHELGHAATARRFGCTVAISLNLFVGWASYSSAQPLTRRRRILVSAMGPGTQLIVAFAVLSVVYQRFHASAIGRIGTESRRLWGDVWIGVSWAGVVIALLNLLPLWPLDGGHIFHGLLEQFLPARQALRAALLFTIGALGAIVIFGLVAKTDRFGLLEREQARPRAALEEFVNGGLPGALWAQVRSFPAYLLNLPWFLLLFSGMNTIQTLNRLSAAERGVGGAIAGARIDGPLKAGPAQAGASEAGAAEAFGWHTDSSPSMPKGWTASPWLLAHLAAGRGDTGGAQAALARVVTGGKRWAAPDAARAELAPILTRVAQPWPIDDPTHSRLLLAIATHHAPPEQFLDYADRLYRAHHDPDALLIAARGLARRGYPDDAMAWLSRAAVEIPDSHRVTAEPDLASLHARPDFQDLLARLRLRTG